MVCAIRWPETSIRESQVSWYKLRQSGKGFEHRSCGDDCDADGPGHCNTYAQTKLYQQIELLRDGLRQTGVELARRLGCLNPCKRVSRADPDRGQFVVGDGTVVATSVSQEDRRAAHRRRALSRHIVAHLLHSDQMHVPRHSRHLDRRRSPIRTQHH